MRKSFSSVFIASALAVLLAVPRPAFAWGNTGHEAVACVAWKQLDQKTKDRVWALLQLVPTRTDAAGTKSIPGFKEWSANLPDGLSVDEQHMYVFMRAATYPDSIKHTFLQDSDNPPTGPDGYDNLGFTDTQSHGYWHFVDTAFGTPVKKGVKTPAMPTACAKYKLPPPATVLPATPAPNAATEIVLLSKAIASDEDDTLKAYDLMWLEHMTGDIHQPLHASERFVNGVGDTGGNCVAIYVPISMRTQFKGDNPKAAPPTELHAFWDDLPGVGTQMDTAKAATFAATVPAAPSDQAAIDSPDTWSSESFAITKKDVYSGPILVGFGTPKAYVITPVYLAKANADAKARIALAGARLANLLTANLK